MLHTLLHSQSYALRFSLYSSLQETQSSNSSHSQRRSISTFNHIHFHLIYIYTHMIHAELKILFYLPLTFNKILLHSYFFILNKNSSIYMINSVTTYTTFINTNSIWIKWGSLELTLTSVGLAWHSRLFKRSTFCRSFRIWG